MIRKNPVKFRFYDSKEKQLLYPENTPTAKGLKIGFRYDLLMLQFLFLH